MAVLKAMTSGGERRELDFYPTPEPATRALLPVLSEFRWPKAAWEPCCGDGAISKVLEARGWAVFSGDFVYRGFGVVKDFFGYTIPPTSNRAVYDTIITNPPFGEADRFIEHARYIGMRRMALLLKIDFWNAASRREIWDLWPPMLICPLTWRLDFTGAGRPHTNCMWCIWDVRRKRTEYRPLAKPVVGN